MNSDFTFMLIDNWTTKLWHLISFSPSDTSGTSYLQKCSPNVVCCFWSPCRTSYSSQKSRFFTFTLLHLTHMSSSNTPLHPGSRQMPSPLGASHLWCPGGCWQRTLGSLHNDDDDDSNENGKKSDRFRQAKQQLCTCITLFCTFLCRRCTTTTWNWLISRFVEDGKDNNGLFLFLNFDAVL